MRHHKHKFSLGRKKEHRIALIANLAVALIKNGQIKTTLAKAKALRPFIEKIITIAKKSHGGDKLQVLNSKRLVLSKIRDKKAVEILFNKRLGEFLERPGGYTRIYKLGARLGDAAELAIISLISATDEGYGNKSKKSEAEPVKETEATKPKEEAVAEEPVAEEAEAVTEEANAEK